MCKNFQNIAKPRTDPIKILQHKFYATVFFQAI